MSRGIICKRIPAEFVSDKDVGKQYFSEFGRIRNIVYQPGFCVVEYETPEEAKRALHGSGFYKGKTFIVQSQNLSTSIDSRSVQAELDIMSGVGGRPQQQQPQQPQRLPLKIPRPQLPLLVTKAHPKETMAPAPPTSPVMIHKMTVPQLQKLVASPALTSEQKYRVLDARDKLYRIKIGQTTDITRAKSTKGACPDMCPEKERLMREAKHQIASFEMTPTSRHHIDHRLAVKQYSRSSADQEMPLPSELRSEPVLRMTMMYLLHEIADLCDTAEVGVSDWFHFLWDRTRSIRKDITQQELCCQGSVRLVEQCARFHIHCAARLVAEEPQVFDQKINTENLTKCLQSLKYMYHDLRLRGEQCPNEAEFRAYIILLNLHDSNFLWEVKQLPGMIQQSAEVRFAIDVFKAMEQNNYVRFFKLVRRTTYLNSCILLRYFNQVRARALATIVKAYSIKSAVPLSLSSLAYSLAFEDEQSGAQFFEYYGLSCDEERVHVDRSSFYYPDLPYIMDRAINVVEQKRFVSAGAVMAGGEDHLAPKSIYLNHVPENSFDSKGYLRSSARDGGMAASSAESDDIAADGEEEGLDQDEGNGDDAYEEEGNDDEMDEEEDESIAEDYDEGDNIDEMSDGQDESEGEEFVQEIPEHVFKKPSPASSPFRPSKYPFSSPANNVFKTPERLPNLPVSGFSFADLMPSSIPKHPMPSPKSPGQVSSRSPFLKPSTPSSGGFTFTDASASTISSTPQLPKTPQTPDEVKEGRRIAAQLQVESVKRNVAAQTDSLMEEVSRELIRSTAAEAYEDHIRLLADCRKCEEAITSSVVRELIIELHREESLDYHVGVYARQKLLKRAFAGWRKRTAANRFSRDLAQMTPLWLPPMPLGDETATALEPEHQGRALCDLARYRRGLPNAMQMTSPAKERVDVERQIANQLARRYPKHGELFFKLVISIPGPGEESFGASEYLQRWFKENLNVSTDHRLPMVFSEVRLNDFHSVGICIRLLVGGELRQEDGSVLNINDENLDGVVFYMSESRSAEPRQRFQRLIERFRKKEVPMVVLNMDDYVAEERIMMALGMDDDRVGPVLVDSKTEKRRMKETFQESIDFLVEQHSLPNANLRAIPLANLVAAAIGETFWMRLHINSKVNAATHETLKHGQLVAEIYNEGVEKLMEMCCQDYSACVNLSRDFKKMVSQSNASSNYYHHFPADWRSKERREMLRGFLGSLKLTQFPPVRIANGSFETMAMLQDYLKVLFSAAPYLVPNIILHMVQSMGGEPMTGSWAKPMQLLAQELFLYRLRQANSLPETVIYDEKLFVQYNETPWWLHSAILKRRVEIQPSVETEGASKKRKLLDLEPLSTKGLDDILERANKCFERANRITVNFKQNQDALASISSKYDERLSQLRKF